MMGLPAGAGGMLMPQQQTPGVNPAATPGMAQQPGGILAAMQKGAPGIAGLGGMNMRQMLPMFGMNLLAQPQGRNAFSNALGGTMGMVGQMQQSRAREELLKDRKDARELAKQTRAEVRTMADTAYQDMYKRFMSDNVLSPRENQALEMMKIVRSTGDPSQYQEALKSLPGTQMFQGTGMESQMYNILGDPSAPEAMRRAMAERAQRQRTLVTPQGTTVIPGMSDEVLAALTGGTYGGSPPPGQSPPGQSGMVPKPLTEGEAADRVAAATLSDFGAELDGLLSAIPGFDPADRTEGLRASLPFNLGTDEMQQYISGTNGWVSMKTKLMSGAAVRPDELDMQRGIFFPVPGDKPRTVASKKVRRLKEEQRAWQKGVREGRASPEEAQAALARIARELPIAEQQYNALLQGDGELDKLMDQFGKKKP